ncbi:MAG TPA: NAD-dependent epimerase/dehydratase family protein [Bacteroidota bacterium]|nr:NAD-dependent epimerase/dehydratase family protein [Candidatus Kapabacteria bacterium]HRS01571.1 NAD-dependent epimerase/dehydratase family protein [Bacteroidota bacterium]
MKVLVTGATGFIGSHLVDKLLEKNYSVIATIRKTSNLQWLVNKPIQLIEASLNDKAKLIDIVKDVDYVYNVAGVIAAKSYEDFLKANRDGTKNLIEAVYESNPNIKRFVHISSQAAAGPATSLDNPVKESDECHPITSYGKSKKEGEDVVLSFKNKMPITIIRPPSVYGPRDPAIRDIFRIGKMGLGPLMGFNDKYVSLIHCFDLVRGIIMAGESEKAKGEIYFITSKEFYSWLQIMEVLKQALGKKLFIKIRFPQPLVLAAGSISEFFGKFSKKPPVFDKEKAIDFIQDYWICSPEKAKNDFGFESQIDLQSGFNETARWYIENKWI